jgi:hypothetical protein
MRRVIAVVGLGLALSLTARAQDGPVTIKLKKLGPGESSRETKSEKGTTKITISVGGMDQVKTEEGVGKFAYTEEVIERPAGANRPTKLKRTYETAEVTKNGEKESVGLAGKTVLIEKKGDKYAFSADGKELTGKAAELLGKEFNKPDTPEEVFLPKKPVKVGESWKLNVADVTKELAAEGMTIDPAKSTVTAKLTKAYDKGGRKFGVIEVRMDLAITKVAGGGTEIPLKDGSKLTVELAIDACIDGTQDTGSAKTTMKGDLTGEVMGVAVKIALVATSEGSSVEVTKK